MSRALNPSSDTDSHTAALFEKLILPHEKALYAPAFALTRSRADAEDLVQETLVRAYARFETFRVESAGSPLAWLQTILRHVFISSVRKKGHSSKMLSLDAFDLTLQNLSHERSGGDGRRNAAGDSAERLALTRMEADAVLNAVRALPADCRRVVFLSDVEGMTYAEIAAILGIPEGTVRSRLSRGRARVRRALFGWHFDEMGGAGPKRTRRSRRLTC